jgi:choline dehydrogenase-like flavoprotein
MKVIAPILAMASLVPRLTAFAPLRPVARSLRFASSLSSSSTEEEYDLVVIGAGSGGVRCSRISAGYGKKVAILEPQLNHGAPNYSAIGGTVRQDCSIMFCLILNIGLCFSHLHISTLSTFPFHTKLVRQRRLRPQKAHGIRQ